MSEKNAQIRKHLAQTATERRSHNRFSFGAVEIKIDHDSPKEGVGFTETITVSVYDPNSNTDVVFTANIADVQIIENAL